MGVGIIKSALYWSWILFALANGFFLYRLTTAYVPAKEKRICKAALFLLMCGTSGMVIWVGDNNLLMTLPVFMLLYLITTKGDLLGRIATGITFFCLIMSVCAILDTYMPRAYRINYSDVIVRVARPAVFGLLYLILQRRLPSGTVRLSRRLWRLVLGLSAMPFSAMIAVVLLTYQRYDYEVIHALSLKQGLVVLPFVLVTAVVILFAVLTLADYERLARENRLASLREVYYQGIRREQTQVRILRHDLRNHLTVLQGLVEHGDREKAQAYLEQIVGSPALQGSRQLCENEAANAVVSAKAEEMGRNGLIPDLQITLPPELPIADTDLCALLGNALDNAMEAADKAGDKKIFMRCRSDKGMLILKVRNALAGDEREDLATTKPDQKHHGLGLAGMREIAERYGGILEASTEGGCFELLVCLPLHGDV